MQLDLKNFSKIGVLSGVVFLAASCSTLINNITAGLSEDLTTAILASEDIQVVREGLPSYLILVDSLVQDKPSSNLLRGAAVLNSSYATAFVIEPERQKAFALKAFGYAEQAACMDNADFCAVGQQTFEMFKQRVDRLSVKDLESAYVLATSWATYIQTHSDNWGAVAQLSSVKTLMERILVLDETYENGAPHMYMGVFETLFPPAMGGKPEKGRAHFERAIELSQQKNLYAKALLAESYARLVYDQELHDRLVDEVLSADPIAGDLTLQNYLAKELATELKESAKDYF